MVGLDWVAAEMYEGNVVESSLSLRTSSCVLLAVARKGRLYCQQFSYITYYTTLR